MQTTKVQGRDVTHNVQKLPRSKGDAETTYRVSFDLDGSKRTVDVKLPDFVAEKDDADSARKRTEYIRSLPEKALERALAEVFPTPAAAAAPRAKAPAPEVEAKAPFEEPTRPSKK